MSKYPRILLVASLNDIEADLAALQAHFGEDNYWTQKNRPYQKVLQPATYTAAGEVDQPAVLSENFYCNVILPINHDFDLGTLNTVV